MIRWRMTVFAKKNMAVVDWARVQDQMGSLQMALGAPVDLMMLSADSGERGIETIYLGLPDAKMLDQFLAFEVIDRATIPDYLSTLICREDGFAERFPDIAAKRRARLGRKDKPTLKARHAAELIKGMGGGDVTIVVHPRGEISITAISAIRSIDAAQSQAEMLLAEVKQKYKIIPD
jgi:hypothetical protein